MSKRPAPNEATKDENERQAPVVEPASGAAWVMEMHAHFHQTGFYRSEDVQRVLGDQRHHVDIPVVSGAVTVSSILKK